MKHIMFDIDGTLIESFEFDEVCFIDAVRQVTELCINKDWATYPDVTDRGLLMTFIERQAPQYQINTLEPLVKAQFICNVKAYLNSTPAKELPGAKHFVAYLLASKDHHVTIATGGWEETARMKLQSAGFDISNIMLASSNDHHRRIEIMTLASSTARIATGDTLSYFGDAQWDVDACNELDINLILVGDRAVHHQRIKNFQDLEIALEHI